MESSRRHTNANRVEIVFSWLVLVFFSGAVMMGCFKNFRPLGWDFQSYELSDWLINYEGGFVRRGLLGQVLMELEKLHLYDVRLAIALIIAVCSVAILWILVHIFRKEGWTLLIIPTGLCLGYTFMNVWGRRDLLSLTMTFFIFLSYRQAVSKPRQWIQWTIFHTLSVLQILIHEASFFYTFPILMLHYFYRLHKQHISVPMSIVKCLLQFLPMLLTMGIVCIFKGDQHVSEAIWASWNDVFNAFAPQALTTPGESVLALGWDAGETFGNHLYTSYLGCFHPTYWGIPMTLFNLLATYFLLTRVSSVRTGLYPHKGMNHTMMSDIALVQFVALLPMYTVLSCDWGRTLPYLVISSVFFYHLFKQEAPLFSRRLNCISSRLQATISGNRILTLPAIYILLVLLIPIPRYHIPFDSLNTFQQRFQVELLRLINH